MNIPLVDLSTQYTNLKPKLMEAFERLFDSGHFVLGSEVDSFEREIADYLGVRFAMGVTSGTDALHVALKVLGIGPGDLVLTSSFTFFATVSAICSTGAEPVFVDVLEDNFNLDPSLVEEQLNLDVPHKKIKALLPVHLYGQSADMEALVRLSQAYRVPIIEDAAQAIGTTFNGKKVGGFGEFGCFSFFPTKNLGSLGDAGLLTTNDAQFFDKAKLIRTHGMNVRYYHECLGGNFRIDTLQAAMLRVFLPNLDGWISARQRIAEEYTRCFSELKDHLITPAVDPRGKHTYHQYTLRIKNGRRDEFAKFLKNEGIGNSIYYPVPAHLQKPMQGRKRPTEHLPITERLAQEVISIPVHPAMTQEQQDYVLGKILAWAHTVR